MKYVQEYLEIYKYRKGDFSKKVVYLASDDPGVYEEAKKK